MRKQEQEELRRLEAALLESEYSEDSPMDELGLLEETWQNASDVRCDVYNADSADVDLEAYSLDVQQGRRSNLIPALVTVLALTVLVAMILWLLEYLGAM